jgi:hypothetical protein
MEMVHPSADLDEVIRENFMLRTRNRIHYKVLEYLYRAAQILILDQKDTISAENLVVLLRFIDCVTWDPSAIYEEIRGLSSLRHDYTKAIADLADKSTDLRILKLSAIVLSNAQTTKAWPKNINSLLSKFMHFTEIGETLLEEQTQEDFDLEATIYKIQNQLSFCIDFVPSKNTDFNFLHATPKWICYQ